MCMRYHVLYRDGHLIGFSRLLLNEEVRGEAVDSWGALIRTVRLQEHLHMYAVNAEAHAANLPYK